MIETVGVEQLRRGFNRYLRRVKEEGLIIYITKHGRPVAMLQPYQPDATAQQTESVDAQEKR